MSAKQLDPFPVCWTLKGERGDLNASRYGQVHWALDGRTGCGRETDGQWDFWGHRYDEGDIGPTCKRCLAAMKKAGVTFEPEVP